MVFVGVIGHPARRHPGVAVAREVQELLCLVAPEVAQDPSVALALEEPRRPGGQAGPVQAHADDLQDAADGSLVDQLAGEHGAFHVQTLAEVDGVFSPRLLGHFLDLVKLRQGGERRFVREVILAVAHHPHPEGGVVARHRCPRHQVDARVLQDLGLGRGDLRSREVLGESGRLAGVWRRRPTSAGHRPLSGRCTFRRYARGRDRRRRKRTRLPRTPAPAGPLGRRSCQGLRTSSGLLWRLAFSLQSGQLSRSGAISTGAFSPGRGAGAAEPVPVKATPLPEVLLHDPSYNQVTLLTPNVQVEPYLRGSDLA